MVVCEMKNNSEKSAFGKNKLLLIVVSVLAFVVFIAGIGRCHFKPWTFSFSLEDPISIETDSDGTTVVDHFGDRMLFFDKDLKLRNAVNVRNFEAPDRKVSRVFRSGNNTYALAVTKSENRIVKEEIAIYDLRGRLLKQFLLRKYDENENCLVPFYQAICLHKDSIRLVGISDRTLHIVSLPENGACSASHRVLSFNDPLIYVSNITDDGLVLAYSLYGNAFCYDFKSGVITKKLQIERVEDEMQMYGMQNMDDAAIELFSQLDFDVDECRNERGKFLELFCVKADKGSIYRFSNGSPVTEHATFGFTIGYLVWHILFWLSLLYMCAMVLCLLWHWLKKIDVKAVAIVVMMAVLMTVIVVFYTMNVYNTEKRRIEDLITYQLDMLKFVAEENYSETFAAIDTMGVERFVNSTDGKKCTKRVHGLLEKFMCYSENDHFYMYLMVYSNDGRSYLLTDNMNSTPLGVAYFQQDLIDSLMTKGIGSIHMVDDSYYYSSREICNQSGKPVAKLVSMYSYLSLQKKQRAKAVELFFSIMALLIAAYASLVLFSSIAKDLRKYWVSRRQQYQFANGFLFPSFYALIGWFKDIDKYVMVFVIPCFATSHSFTELATITANVLMCYSLGSVLSTPITKFVCIRYGNKTVGIVASLLSMLAYGMMIVAIQTTQLYLFCAAKVISGATVGNVLSVVCNSVATSVEDKPLRTRLFVRKKEVANSSALLTILLGGYIAQYMNPIAIYVFAIVLSALLIVLSFVSLSGAVKSKEQVQNQNSRSLRQMATSLKFFTKRDALAFCFLVLLPSILLFGYHDFIFPLYSSNCGMSPLLLSNIMVIGMTLNLLFRNVVNDFYDKLGTAKSIVFYSMLISVSLLLFVVSPNIIWAVVICILIFVLKINACEDVYFTDLIDRMGYKQQDVYTDTLIVENVFRTVRMPFMNFLVALGRNFACVGLGLVCAALTAWFALFSRKEEALPQQKSFTENS